MTRSLSPLRLAYSVLAGPILWFVHFVAVWAIAEFGCRANFNNLVYFTPNGIRIAVLAFTVVVLVLVGAGGVLAYQGWTSAREIGNDPSARERERFLHLVGLLFSALFLLTILVTALPAFFLDVCDQVV